MRKKQFTEGERLERALKRGIAIREVPMRSPEWHAAIRELVMLKKSLTEPDLERRRARRVEMGMPPLNSPEWKAELERLRPLEARGRTLHEPPENVDRLTRDLMTIAARQANGEAVALFKTPGQHSARNPRAIQGPSNDYQTR